MEEKSAYEMSTRELWNFINDYKEMISEEDYEKIKYGVNIKFDIRWEWKGTILRKPEKNKVRIPPFGEYKYTEYLDEIEEREKLMRAYYEQIVNDEITEPRTTK